MRAQTTRRGPRPMRVYHIEDDADSDEPLQYAWRWLEERRHLPRLVVVPVNNSLGHSRVLAAITTRVRYVTKRTFLTSGNLRDAAVLAVWPSEQILHEIGERRPAELLVVQWHCEDSDPWLRAHSSEPLLGGPTLRKPTIKDPVVRMAMECLTNFTNLRNVLIQSEDRDEAIRTLRTLVGYGYHVDPDELYEWALANNWPGKGATRLRTFAEEIQAGAKEHRLTTPGPRDWGPEQVEYWKKKAAANTGD
jgi:hypothetical protein